MLIPHLGTGAGTGSSRIPAGGEPAKGVVLHVGIRKLGRNLSVVGSLTLGPITSDTNTAGQVGYHGRMDTPGNEGRQIGPGASTDNDERWVESRMDNLPRRLFNAFVSPERLMNQLAKEPKWVGAFC